MEDLLCGSLQLPVLKRRLKVCSEVQVRKALWTPRVTHPDRRQSHSLSSHHFCLLLCFEGFQNKVGTIASPALPRFPVSYYFSVSKSLEHFKFTLCLHVSHLRNSMKEHTPRYFSFGNSTHSWFKSFCLFLNCCAARRIRVFKKKRWQWQWYFRQWEQRRSCSC